MKGILFILLFCSAIVTNGWGQQGSSADGDDLVRFVHPMIGTAPATTPSALAHGIATENSAQVVPAVTMPFGMTNWTAQTRAVETKCVAPYYYSDTLLTGFRGSHWISGSCTQDYGSLTVMPLSGSLRCTPAARGSRFSHSREVATPYYYRTTLDDYRIEAEITATERCGICRFTFESGDTATILVEPNSDYGQGCVRILPEENAIVGYNPVHRIYQGWGEPAGFSGYFVARFSEPFSAYGVYEGSDAHTSVTEASSRKGIGAFIRFHGSPHRTIVVRIGTSFTSIEQARKNLAAETDGKDFESAKAILRNRWNAMLGKVRAEGGSETAKVKFYSAMYHSFLLPRIFNDCDGSYPSFGGGDSICNSGKSNYYCDFSLWDTFRALHPLFTLLIPETNAAMVRSLLLKAEQGGWLPIFPCWNSYTSAMIGDHAIAVIGDAVVKGTVKLTDRQYGYLKKNATEMPADRRDYVNGKGVRALDSYIRYGYIPLDDSVKESFHKGEQVSRTLEYAFDDFALSQIAGAMGKTKDQRHFLARSKNYRNVYNPAVRCVSGRFADGHFTSEFVKTQRMPYITEGTPWQYTWYVPHDLDGLITLMGGRAEFNSNLDEFFANGQYWHGNEPDQQVPFLYNYSGQPSKTLKIVSRILEDEYGDTPGGLSGNDDAGQISAWYVFASMGLYPVCPSKDEYTLTSPAFDKITLALRGGKKLVITAEGASKGKNCIAAIDFNGRPITNYRIRHTDLVKGGVLRFKMRREG